VNALATHIHLELWGVETHLLNDPLRLEQILVTAARAAGCEVLGTVRHRFEPQSASVVVLVSESHVSIHTWPEYGYAAADILTCGQALPDAGVKSLIAHLAPQRSEVQRYDRGELQKPLKK
jgi:S-adenosylmethionine decarboxylase